MSGGLSTAGLARVHRVLGEHVERGSAPGLVAVISRRGDTHIEVHGTVAAAGEGAPVHRDTPFRIASMTKPVTAVAALLLVEDCVLRLDDPVDDLLPELSGRRVLNSLRGPLDDTRPARRPLTLRDLLTFQLGFGQLMAPPDAYPILAAAHTAGIGMGPPQPRAIPEPDEWLRRLGTLPLMYEPGERWLYNTGSDVLGVLIARASGQPFGTFLAERVFGPLGMTGTGFSVPPGESGQLPVSYWTDPATGTNAVYDEPAGQWSTPPAFPSGGAGLISTAGDYLAFAMMLLRGGRHAGGRLLSRPAVDLMTSDHLTPAQKSLSGLGDGFFDHDGWGFGVSVTTRQVRIGPAAGAYGWNGGLGTTWRNDPAEDMVAILLTQQMFTSPAPPPIARDFETAAYAAIDS